MPHTYQFNIKYQYNFKHLIFATQNKMLTKICVKAWYLGWTSMCTLILKFQLWLKKPENYRIKLFNTSVKNNFSKLLHRINEGVFTKRKSTNTGWRLDTNQLIDNTCHNYWRNRNKWRIRTFVHFKIFQKGSFSKKIFLKHQYFFHSCNVKYDQLRRVIQQIRDEWPHAPF